MIKRPQSSNFISYLAVFLLASLIVSGGYAFSVYAHGGDNSLIHGCVKTSNGDIRIVTANGTCAGNESALDWPANKSSGGGVFAFSGFNDVNNTTFCSSLAGNEGACSIELETPITANGKFVTLAVSPFLNTSTTGGPATVTVLINGVATALKVEIPQGSTQVVIDNTNVNVQAGDLVMIETHYPGISSNGQFQFRASLQYQAN